ncbi:hypothetical protein SVAN01_04693 [Stagonosporopsis vannaccii]|nr:hypothetical protein SVAN01_04693 [Stagonosporopsis vannaccii]
MSNAAFGTPAAALRDKQSIRHCGLLNGKSVQRHAQRCSAAVRRRPVEQRPSCESAEWFVSASEEGQRRGTLPRRSVPLSAHATQRLNRLTPSAESTHPRHPPVVPVNRLYLRCVGPSPFLLLPTHVRHLARIVDPAATVSIARQQQQQQQQR